jgi:AbiV family abortive infection protein
VLNAAHRNAKRLALDAKRLFDAGSYSTAMGLAVLALEEHGKAMLMVQVALHRDAKQKAATWRDFYKHRPKVFGQLMRERFRQCKTAQDLETAWAATEERVQYVDENLKQAAFYVGVNEAGDVSEPAKAFPKERVEHFVRAAELLTAKNDEPTPVDFIKLMEKHFAGKFDSSATPQDLQSILFSVGPFLKEAEDLFPENLELLDSVIEGMIILVSFLKSATVT